jgi:hypothetical protein
MTGPGYDSVDIDQFDAAIAADAKPKEPEGLPDELKGKKPEEVVELYKTVADGFKKSEQARTQLQERLQQAAAPAPMPAVQPIVIQPPEPAAAEPTDEQLRELFSTDPVAATKAMTERESKRISRLYEDRLQPLTASIMSLAATQEMMARDRHKVVFERYGARLEELKKDLPPQALANPSTWDQLVNLVKGEKFQELEELSHQERVKASQIQQKETGGVSMGPTPSGQPRSGPTKLDSLQMEVATKMGMTAEEYVKWANLGSGNRLELEQVT